MNDKLVYSENLLKRFVAMLDKQPLKDADLMMMALQQIASDRKTPTRRFF